MRKFDSGATRDIVEGKFDFEGFLSPLVLNRYAEFMNKHRTQADGNLRDSDNWQKGIPIDTYMKSGFRHFFDWWANHRHADAVVKEDVEESLCALLFNAMGYLHEYLKDKAGDYNAAEIDGPKPKFKAGDEVKIDLLPPMGKEIIEACVKANYIGVYVCKGGGGSHIIDVGALKGRWFLDSEISSMEDN